MYECDIESEHVDRGLRSVCYADTNRETRLKTLSCMIRDYY